MGCPVSDAFVFGKDPKRITGKQASPWRKMGSYLLGSVYQDKTLRIEDTFIIR